MTKHHHPGLRSVHRALADPLRIRLLECLWGRSQSAKELAEWAGMAPDRLYYHLDQLEEAKMIEIAQYPSLPRHNVEPEYRPTSDKPPVDEATPLQYAAVHCIMLEAT